MDILKKCFCGFAFLWGNIWKVLNVCRENVQV